LNKPHAQVYTTFAKVLLAVGLVWPLAAEWHEAGVAGAVVFASAIELPVLYLFVRPEVGGTFLPMLMRSRATLAGCVAMLAVFLGMIGTGLEGSLLAASVAAVVASGAYAAVFLLMERIWPTGIIPLVLNRRKRMT